MTSMKKVLFLLVTTWTLGFLSANLDRDDNYGRCKAFEQQGKWFRCVNVSREIIFSGTFNLSSYEDFVILHSDLAPFGDPEWTSLKDAVYIWINGSGIESLPLDGFRIFQNLQTLELQHNHLEAVPPHAFLNFTIPENGNVSEIMESKFDIVDLSFNKIRIIEDDSFLASSITHLFLQRNNLTDIDGKFQFLSGLRVLNLGHNAIDSVEKGSFPNMGQLRKLSLSGNPIKHISKDAFSSMTSLRTLNLDNTHISSLGWIIRPVHVAAFRYLENLHLSHTHLKSLPETIFDAIPTLSNVYLNGNKWNCDERLRFLPRELRRNNRHFHYGHKLKCFSPPRMHGKRIWNWKPRHRPSEMKVDKTTATSPHTEESLKPPRKEDSKPSVRTSTGPAGNAKTKIIVISVVVCVLCIVVAICIVMYLWRRRNNAQLSVGDTISFADKEAMEL